MHALSPKIIELYAATIFINLDQKQSNILWFGSKIMVHLATKLRTHIDS